jgi:hypothetical protein
MNGARTPPSALTAPPAPGPPRGVPPDRRPPARSHALISVAPLANKTFATPDDDIAIIDTATGTLSNNTPEPTPADAAPIGTMALCVSPTRPPAIAVHGTIAWARKRAEPVAAFRARVLGMAEFYELPYVIFFPKPKPHLDIRP